jgi:predicted nucleotidyltransferase
MPTSHSKEPDAARAETIAREGCILRCVVGSTVHGLSNPGTDDRDEMGVCVEPREYVLGLRPFDHWVSRTQDEGVSSGPGDLYLTIYGLRKYCRLAGKGSPTVLLLLFVDGDCVIERRPLGEELQALAGEFICRLTGRAFLGYLEGQRRGLLGERHATRTRELAERHGYDTKYAMHALRITLPVAQPTREALMEVRRGSLPLAEVLERLRERTTQLERALLDSQLPETPNAVAIDAFLARAYERIWAEGSY